MSSVTFVDYAACSYVPASHVVRNCWFTARLYDKQSAIFVRAGDTVCQLFPEVIEFEPADDYYFTDFIYRIPIIRHSKTEKPGLDPMPFLTGKIKSYKGLFVSPAPGRYVYLGVSPQFILSDKKIKKFVEVDVEFGTIGDYFK